MNTSRTMERDGPGTQNVETCKSLRKSMRDNYPLSQRLNYIELNEFTKQNHELLYY